MGARERAWSVYVLCCQGGSFYTGISKDVPLRLKTHGAGKGSAYTRAHLPVALIYQKSRYTHSGALKEEARIKALSRLQKETMLKLR